MSMSSSPIVLNAWATRLGDTGKPIHVVLQKGGVWPELAILRQADLVALLLEEGLQLGGYAVVGHQKAVVRVDRYQVPIEQPVDRAG